MTKTELEKKIKGLGKITDQQKKEAACVLIGHSKIQTACFGYFNCGRCGDQLGDSLGSSYSGATTAVIIGHNCKTCRANYKKCTWVDTYLVPDPFKKQA